MSERASAAFARAREREIAGLCFNVWSTASAMDRAHADELTINRVMERARTILMT